MKTKSNPENWLRKAIFLLLIILCPNLLDGQYASDLDPELWVADDPEENDQAGYDVAIFEDYSLVSILFGDNDQAEGGPVEDAGIVDFLEVRRSGFGAEPVILKLQEIFDNDAPSTGEYFGGSVSIYNNLIGIGADSKTFFPVGFDPVPLAGAASMFKTNYKYFPEVLQVLFAEDPHENAFYAYAVEIFENSLAVSEPGATVDGVPAAGQVNLYELINDSWVYLQSVHDNDLQEGAFFGSGLSMFQDVLLVGSPLKDINTGEGMKVDAGSVTAFWKKTDKTSPSWYYWDQEGARNITNGESSEEYDYAGYSVAGLKLNDDLYVAAFGAVGADYDANGENFVSDAGAVDLCLFNGNHELEKLFKLVVPEGHRTENLYSGLSLDVISEGNLSSNIGLRMYAGATGDGTDGNGENYLPNAGSVWECVVSRQWLSTIPKQFHNNNLTPDMNEEIPAEPYFSRKIVPSDRAAGDNFGNSLAASDNMLVIGANLKDYIIGEDTIVDAGAAYFVDLCETVRDTITDTACGSYISPSGNYTWTESGTYNDTIPGTVGCDSIITIKLTVTKIDNSVSKTGNTLKAAQNDATYQWLDCDNAYMPINGEDMQTFSPPETGNYAVRISDGECSDTSICQTITKTSSFELTSDDQLRVFPNPASGRYRVDLGTYRDDVTLKIMSMLGQKVEDLHFRNCKTIDFDISGPAGIYITEIAIDGDPIVQLKVVKQ